MSVQAPTAATGAPDATALPARIGKYLIRARLGEGATSEVFLAHDDFRGVDIAIKRFRPGLAGDALERRDQQGFFAAEAALVGRLQHPNVVRILDAVADEPAPYLVMEYVQGVTLRHFCRPDALLSLEQIVEIGFKCAMALGYVHRLGVIHRDVKPANLLAVMRGDEVIDVKITDFGGAFDFSSEKTQIYRVGSLAYMSPEQLDGNDLDGRTDIYSLAAVLYHLIAGRAPFEAPQQAALMYQIHTANAPSLQTLRAGVSPGLDQLILGALAKPRELRPATWEAFAQALSSLVANREVPRARRQGVLDSERYTLLRAMAFFRGFGDVELWEIVHRAKWQHFPVGRAIYRKGQPGDDFHIVAVGEVEVFRDDRCVARLGAGASVGEMAYLAPSPELRLHSADVIVSRLATTISLTPQSLGQLSIGTRHHFDEAFIGVLVRRLHAAHEALAHPRRIL